MKRILEAAFDKPGICWAAAKEESSSGGAYGAGVSVELSPSAGFENLVDHLWPQVVSGSSGEALAAVCRILRKQPETHLIADYWYREAIEMRPEDLRFWCTVGNWLAAFKELDFNRFKAIIATMNPVDFDWGLAAYVQAGGSMKDMPLAERRRAVIAILNGVGDRIFQTRTARNQMTVVRATEPPLYANIIRSPQYGRFVIADMDLATGKMEDADYYPLLEHAEKILDDQRELSFSYWREFFERMRSTFGKTWRECVLTNIAVATKDPSERGAGANSLFNEEYALLDRLRNARRRSRQEVWWERQESEAADANDYGLWVLSAFSWMQPHSLVKIIGTFNRAVRELDDATYAVVLDACQLSGFYARFARSQIDLDGAAWSELDWRTKALLHSRLPEDQSRAAEISFLRSRSKDVLAYSVFQDSLTSKMITGRAELSSENIRFIVSGVRRGIVSSRNYYHRDGLARSKDLNEMRRELLKNSWELPPALLSLLHSGADARRRFVPVMEIAEEQEWFGV